MLVRHLYVISATVCIVQVAAFAINASSCTIGMEVAVSWGLALLANLVPQDHFHQIASIPAVLSATSSTAPTPAGSNANRTPVSTSHLLSITRFTTMPTIICSNSMLFPVSVFPHFRWEVMASIRMQYLGSSPFLLFLITTVFRYWSSMWRVERSC